MRNVLLLIVAFVAFANAQFFYDRHGESRGAYKDSMDYATLVELAQRFRGPILVKKPVEGVKPRKNLEKIPQDKIQRTFDVKRKSLRKALWLEVEKNEIVKVCVDRPVVAWETSMNSNIFNDSCLVFTVPTLIGVESIKVYLPESNSSRKINLAVGMKYLDFKNEKVLLGFNEHSETDLKILELQKNEDPERLVSVTGTYLVDKYPVTNCEFTQLMWDDIPKSTSYTNKSIKQVQEGWISRKSASIQSENCIVQDTAASTIYLYQAIKYANARSIRDGLKPYYILSNSSYGNEQLLSEKEFVVCNRDFTEQNFIGEDFVLVSVDEHSDGYRLPYYDEWMMLARGGDKKNRAPWKKDASFEDALKYARMTTIRPKNEKELYLSEPVGQLQPNGYGLYDFFGLVPEHVLMKKNLFRINRDFPSCQKGGGYRVKSPSDGSSSKFFPHWEDFNYGYLLPGFSSTKAGFRLIRNIGNNAKWEEIKSESKR